MSLPKGIVMSEKKAAKPKDKKSEKKTYSIKEFLYFNKTSLPATLVELMDSLCDLSNNIMKEREVRVDMWCTINNYESLVRDLWDNEDAVYFKRCHLDSLVDQFGYMLWNGIEDKIRREWLRSGYLPEVEGVSKKFKKNGEYVSSLIADSELERFKEKFR